MQVDSKHLHKIEKLRKQAKDMSKSSGLQLAVSQNTLASEIGYSSWADMISKSVELSVPCRPEPTNPDVVRLWGDNGAGRAWLGELANSGYSVTVNSTGNAVEFSASTYPDSWKKLYEKSGFIMVDPILISSLFAGNSAKRWSEIKAPDVRGVLKKAADHGLNFGATVTRSQNGPISLLNTARSDREYTDGELVQLSEWFDRFLFFFSGDT